MAAIQLPQELWFQVFGFLSSPDKMNIRSSCKYFKRLIDHRLLWKDSTVVLKKISNYNSQFWKTLRRRKTSSVVVHKAQLKEWKQLAISLPWLTSITTELCFDEKALAILKNFSHLKRLVIRRCRCPALSCNLVPLRHLTHFSVCEIHCVPRIEILSAVSQLTNLTSLHYHEGNKPIPKQAFHDMVRCLPNLKQLSLKMGPMYGSLPDDYFTVTKASQESSDNLQLGELGLTSLELLNYSDPILSPVALERLPSLQSLTVHYRDRAVEPSTCHLKTWLAKLPCVSELVIAQGYPLSVYAHLIPGTVRSLSLIRVITETRAVKTVGRRVPGLLHLHLDPCGYDSHSTIAEIPCLFPQLQTLKLRHHNVTEKELLGLDQLQHMKQLVILDATPGASPFLLDLICKLQVQTNYKVQVIYSLGPKDPTTCYCSHY